jgi:ubiquinone/menaquinone biosynthesis C-methylase UbiE
MNEFSLTEQDRSIIAEMEKAAPTYDDYMRKVTLGRDNLLRQKEVDTAGVKAGDTILEIGCGTGSLTLAAKQKAGPTGKAYGIDVIPAMIAASRQKAEAAGETITFEIGSINQIQYPADQFNVVLCSFMIFHLAEETRRKGITEIWRVLKPGGTFFVADLRLPTQPVQRAIADKILGFSQTPELSDLLPVLKDNHFNQPEVGVLDFKIMGISLIGYVRTRK